MVWSLAMSRSTGPIRSVTSAGPVGAVSGAAASRPQFIDIKPVPITAPDKKLRRLNDPDLTSESSRWLRTFYCRSFRELAGACRMKGGSPMRLWSLHPSMLDRMGLVALWREALLAQKVLRGATKGYHHHPQLDRFRQSRNPARAIANYLWSVADEAHHRGYQFDLSKIAMPRGRATIPVTKGQLAYENA